MRAHSETLSGWRDRPGPRPFIGGSDISAVLGTHPYRTNVDLWAELTGRTPPFQGNRRTRAGQLMEPVIRQLVIEQHRAGWEFEGGKDLTWEHPDHPFIGATPDDRIIRGHISGTARTAEFKNVGFRVAEQWQDGAPRHNIEQGLWNARILGDTGCAVIGLVDGADIHIYEFDVDPVREYVDWMIEEAVEFWTTYVQTDTPPPIRFSKADPIASLASIHSPDPDLPPVDLEGDAAQALAGIATLEANVDEARSRLGDAERQLTGAKATIAQAMGRHTKAAIGGTVVATWKTTRRFDPDLVPADIRPYYSKPVIDGASLKRHDRDLYEACRRPNGRTFRLTKQPTTQE